MAKHPADLEDTVKLLKELLAEAEDGTIDGLAVVALRKDHHSHLRVACGSAVRFVAHTLGGLKLLSDELSHECRMADKKHSTGE